MVKEPKRLMDGSVCLIATHIVTSFDPVSHESVGQSYCATSKEAYISTWIIKFIRDAVGFCPIWKNPGLRWVDFLV